VGSGVRAPGADTKPSSRSTVISHDRSSSSSLNFLGECLQFVGARGALRCLDGSPRVALLDYQSLVRCSREEEPGYVMRTMTAGCFTSGAARRVVARGDYACASQPKDSTKMSRPHLPHARILLIASILTLSSLAAPWPGNGAGAATATATATANIVDAAHASMAGGFAPGDLDPGPVPDLSTETSNTVRNDDGTYTARVSVGPVNYQDDSGDWVPIDNSLVEAPGPAYSVENAANSYTVSIPENPAVTPVKFETEDSWVKMKLSGSEDDSPDVHGDTAEFDLAGAGRVAYDAQEAGVKETITLDAAPAKTLSYHYTLTLSPGILPVQTDSGEIDFRSASGDTVFLIPAGRMSDSRTPDADVSEKVAYSLVQTGSTWSLTLTPDMAWLSDPTRVYPVAIDPTVSVFEYTPKDCWLQQEAGSTTHCGDNRLKVGVNNNNQLRRAVMAFDVSGIPPGATINSGVVYMAMDATQTAGTGGATTWALYNPTADWSNCATWNSPCASGGGPWPVAGVGGGSSSGGGNGGQISLNTQSLGGSTSSWQTWDITPQVRTWVGFPSTNHGALIRQTGENVKKVLGFVSHVEQGGPFLYVTYTALPTVSGVTVGPCPLACSTTDAEVATLTPTFSGQGSSPNTSGIVQYGFEIYDNALSNRITYGNVWDYQNRPISWTVPTGYLNDDRKYQVRFGIWDGYEVGWSAFRSVRTDLEAIDATPPPPGGYSSAELRDLTAIAQSAGISLTQAKSLYGWQDDFSAAVAQYSEQFPGSFSYATLNPNGVPGAKFVFKGSVPPGASSLSSTLPVVPTLAGGAAYTARETAQLVDAAADGIETQLAASPAVAFEVSMDDTSTRVQATISSATSVSTTQLKSAAQSSIVETMPSISVPGVDISIDSSLAPQADSLRGGVLIGNGDKVCTTGIPVRIQASPSNYGIVTADHCADDMTLYSAETLTQRPNLAPSNRRLDASLGDIQYDPAARPGQGMSHPEGLAHSFYTGVGEKTSLVDIGPLSPGMYVCAFGRRSQGEIGGEPTCNFVAKKGVSVKYDDMPYHYSGMIRVAGVISQHGDSGGPVYYGNTVYALVSGHVDGGILSGAPRSYISPLYDTIGRSLSDGGMGLIANTQAVAALYGNG
jgi:hypothetical protein